MTAMQTLFPCEVPKQLTSTQHAAFVTQEKVKYEIKKDLYEAERLKCVFFLPLCNTVFLLYLDPPDMRILIILHF